MRLKLGIGQGEGRIRPPVEDRGVPGSPSKEMNDLYNGIGTTIQNGLVDGLIAAVSGTETLGDAMRKLGADVLATVGRMLILNAISSGLSALGNDGPGKPAVGIFSALAGEIGKRASGGPVDAGKPYLVGEQGPELVLPKASGHVLTAQQTQAAMGRYQPGSGGSGVSDSSGGDLVATGGGQWGGTFTLETVVINRTEYATVDQVRAMGAAASKQGAEGGNAKTMRTLQNSRASRARLGIR